MSEKRFKVVPEMEGAVARWYARQRSSPSQLAAFRRQAARLAADLPEGASVLEVAPGPGHLAIELARLGRFRVAGLDISRTFVEIASENARSAGVSVDFRRGDATCMPFANASFDLVVCQAAFKNFARPLAALDEMHRVLRDGGVAVIQDLSKEASDADIDDEVRAQDLGSLNAFLTKWTLATMLRRRAYSRDQFAALVAESAFGTASIAMDGISLEVRLERLALAEAR